MHWLIQEQQKAKKLGDTMAKLDEEMKRTDQLLYQMIPRTVADRLRKGEPALNTCEVWIGIPYENMRYTWNTYIVARQGCGGTA